MKKIAFWFTTLFLALNGCKNSPTANEIIESAINYSGGELYNNSSIFFEFRDKHYEFLKMNGSWKMSRSFSDSIGLYKDIYSSKGFQRTINDSLIQVHDSMAVKYIESINSVFYFALLPYKLNDEAVISEFLGQEEISSSLYYKVKIKFKEEGGGIDHEDEFIYWFDSKDYSLDYLAYSFQVNGGGKRFRKAYNERIVNGIRFVDYENYKPMEETEIPLEKLGIAFKEEKLELLSKIELKKLEVNQVLF